ncbi:hypothetical protein OPQ81_008921 [Rhizoctonia solani]|nr:hypothetical protein OPQ81_008921 [Rhizoctonia solani]
MWYYDGVPSRPVFVYGTHKEQSPACQPRARCRQKELYTVFGHPLANLRNNGLWAGVVEIMGVHGVFFTTLDVIRFKAVEGNKVPWDDEDAEEDGEEENSEVKEAIVGPVTIWVGVPTNTPPTIAHNAAQDVLALLERCHITDVIVEFRESYYHTKTGPRLLRPVGDLDALVDVISPLTPALGLGINAVALGPHMPSCFVWPNEPNNDYVYRPAGAPSRNVLLLGQKAYNELVLSIKLKIGDLAITARRWEKQIEGFKTREGGIDADHAKQARNERVATEKLLRKAKADMEELIGFQRRVENDWNDKKNRVLGRVLCSPATALGVGDQRFTEDWAIFEVDRDKLGDGFEGNKVDLGTKMSPAELTRKFFPHPEAHWEFNYPTDRLLPIRGVISNEQMCAPSIRDQDGEPCLLVIKHGNSTGTTIGRANGVFSVVRKYKARGATVEGTSLEWSIINYDGKSDAFSECGDSGSAIVDIHGRMGGKLSGGSGSTRTSDMTYATPLLVGSRAHQGQRVSQCPPHCCLIALSPHLMFLGDSFTFCTPSAYSQLLLAAFCSSVDMYELT